MTRDEIIADAHREIAVLSVDRSVTQDQINYAGAKLDNIIAELGITDFTSSTVPTEAGLPMAMLLACDIANHYVKPKPMRRGRAMMRLDAVLYPDDRTEEEDVEDLT